MNTIRESLLGTKASYHLLVALTGILPAIVLIRQVFALNRLGELVGRPAATTADTL